MFRRGASYVPRRHVLALEKTAGRCAAAILAYTCADRGSRFLVGENHMATSGSEIPLRRAPRSSSFIAIALDKLVLLCGVVPYALVGLGLRLLIARVFFLSGQPKISGPEIPISLFKGAEFTIVLPAEIRPETFELFQTQYAALPMPPAVAAYLFSYAEFVLPVCLVLGFATRLSALVLLATTVLIQIYVVPEAFWTAHVYIFAILMVLMSVGPGAISLDAVIRYVYQR
jgi:putative oxidoreductase